MNVPKLVIAELRRNYTQQNLDSLRDLAIKALQQGQSGLIDLNAAATLAIHILQYWRSLQWARKDIRNRISAVKEDAKRLIELCEAYRGN